MPGNCFKCGAESQDGAKFCASCGVEFDKEAFCTSCGKTVKPNQAFCSECGTRAQPTGGDEFKAFVGEWFMKLFPNFHSIKPTASKEYWGALVKGVLGAAVCGGIAMIVFVVAVDLGGGRSYTGLNSSLSTIIGWLVNVYVLWRWKGHVIAGRWLDIEPQKKSQFDIIGWIYIVLAILGAFSVGFATLSYLVLFGGTIYLGMLPSYHHVNDSICLEKKDVDRC